MTLTFNLFLHLRRRRPRCGRDNLDINRIKLLTPRFTLNLYQEVAEVECDSPPLVPPPAPRCNGVKGEQVTPGVLSS